MSDTVIKVENLSKQYRLGVIGSGTLYRDLQSWWARYRGNEDPNTKVGQWDKSQTDNEERFWALKGVSFDVCQGETLGIIGGNGAGKSTLLKVLSRVTGPTSGSIKIKGRVASLLEVGTGFHPELTGRENIYLNGTILGMRKHEIDRKFDEIVEFAEISQFVDTPVKRYSSGMYVRLAFAVASHVDPDILIVDEVLAVGDMQFRKKCLNQMDNMCTNGRTILFVSHDIGQIKHLCNKAILLNKGKIEKIGPTEEVADYYCSSSITIDENNPNIRKNFISAAIAGPKIKCASIVDCNGEYRNRFSSTETFEVKLDIEPYYQSTKPYAAVWFLHDHLGQQVAVGASQPMDSVLYSQKTTVLKCEFDPASLIPGVYILRFILHIPYYDNYDDWKNAISFEITENDLRGTGYSYPGIWSAQQYVSHKWKE